MAMPGTTDRWTREMVHALPDDGQRYELFDGALLVTPAPGMPHQIAVECLRKRLAHYVDSHRLGQVFAGPADLSLGGNQLSQPDLFVLPGLPEDRRWEHAPNPTLVVEVLSASSARSSDGAPPMSGPRCSTAKSSGTRGDPRNRW